MPLFLRDALLQGCRLCGPAIVVQEDTTTCIPAGFAGEVDAHGNLHLTSQE
jgi:N-methylhydantoinase A